MIKSVKQVLVKNWFVLEDDGIAVFRELIVN